MIVGGGTAGLVVAARLTENPKINVGVIEAGGYQPNEDLINIPYYRGRVLGNSSLDWNLATTPQVELQGRKIPHGRGKVLGGTSALHSMVYNRGSKVEYDAWVALGNVGWDSLLPYFKASETVTPGQAGIIPGIKTAPGVEDYSHGRKGPLEVSYITDAALLLPDLAKMFAKSLLKAGGYPNADPDGGNATGIYIRKKRRDL